MSSKRPYYDNAYVVDFSASVVERASLGDRPAVVLDQTYFYPTSGGQPNDTGTIDGIRVVDVCLREGDVAILHILKEEISGGRVDCRIDWARRFDHMQQHSGQHLLSAAFERLVDVDTVGFHLGHQSSTIDLAVTSLTADQLAAVEGLANEMIYLNRPITAAVLTPDESSHLVLRKPPAVTGPIRIVNVADFDLSACGGTHVRQTGEIGLIKIIRTESRSTDLRVEFLCGRRALADYHEKNALVTRIANGFTTGQDEIENAIDRLRDETRVLRSDLRKARAELLKHQGENLYQKAEHLAGMRVVTATFVDHDRNDLNWLARNLVERPGVVVLFGLAGTKCHLVFARAPDVDHDMVPLLKSALGVLNSSSGGGRPEFAQGGGPAADESLIAQAIDVARQRLLAR